MSEKKSMINLARVPVGVKYLKENDMPKDFDEIQNPKTRSYCDALRLLHEYEYPNGLIATLDSINVCKWCPVALGLKHPETGLEKKIEPLFNDLNQGVHIFNMTNKITEPDVVTLIANRENTEKIIEAIGIENFTRDYIEELTHSNLSEFTEEEFPSKRAKRKHKRHLRSIRLFNWLFASKLISNRFMTWFLTGRLKRYWFTRLMDPILRKYSTGMSLCYSASGIPYTKQKANVAFVDTGAIAWGNVSKDTMIVGLPNSIFKTLESKVLFQKMEE